MPLVCVHANFLAKVGVLIFNFRIEVFELSVLITSIVVAGNNCWLWSVWRHLLPGSYWRGRICLSVARSKCHAGIFLWRGIYLFENTFNSNFSSVISLNMWDLENSIMQATDLLQKNLENAKASLEVLVADLQFLRDQVTITQVN